jgi:hypothetical protein
VTAKRVVPTRLDSQSWQITETLVVPGLDTDVPGGGRISPNYLKVTYSYKQETGLWTLRRWETSGPEIDERGCIVEGSDRCVYGDTAYAYLSKASMYNEDEDEDEETWLCPPQWILQLAAERAELLPTPPNFS